MGGLRWAAEARSQFASAEQRGLAERRGSDCVTWVMRARLVVFGQLGCIIGLVIHGPSYNSFYIGSAQFSIQSYNPTSEYIVPIN